ncbi:MAG: preprotein translocase subunit YajC [Blastochloris sp.]|nr:preprotein translocase subunit YajC [Blastochloris sp.]
MNSMNMMVGLLAQTAPAAPGTNPNIPFFLQPPVVMMGLMVLMFYFLIIRPQSKRAKEHKLLLESIKSGDKVVAAGGIHGVVTNVKDGIVVVRVAEGVKIEVEKASVSSVTKSSDGEKSSS